MAFQLGGLMGYDPWRQHAELRVYADGFRKIFGRPAVTPDWDKKVSIDSLAPHYKFVVKELISYSRPLLEHGLEHPCEHSFPLRLDTTDNMHELRAASDASQDGGGYHIWMEVAGEVSSLWKDGWIWDKKQRGWHSNRRELKGFHSMGISVNALLERFHPDSERTFVSGSRVLLRILLQCDNAATVAWLKRFESTLVNPMVDSSAIERRAIARLLEAIVAELTIMRSLADDVRVAHCPGVDNTIPDELSRLLSAYSPYDRTVGGALEFVPEEAPAKKKKEVVSWICDDVSEASSSTDRLREVLGEPDWTRGSLLPVPHWAGRGCNSSISESSSEYSIRYKFHDRCCGVSLDIDEEPEQDPPNLFGFETCTPEENLPELQEITEDSEWVMQVSQGLPLSVSIDLCLAISALRSDPEPVTSPRDRAASIAEDSADAACTQALCERVVGQLCAPKVWTECLRNVGVMRRIFRSWYSAVCDDYQEVTSTDVDISSVAGGTIEHLLLVASSQRSDPKISKQLEQASIEKGTKEASQVISETEIPELLVRQTPQASGTTRVQYVISPGSDKLIEFLICSSHRESYHRGSAFTSHMLQNFYIPNLRKRLQRHRKSCVYCQIDAAKEKWWRAPKVPTDLFAGLTMDQILAYPPFTIVAGDFLEMGGLHILTLTCVATRAVAFYEVERTNSRTILYALEAALADFGRGALRLFCCDHATYFRSGEFLSMARQFGISIRGDAPRSPWTIGIDERGHGTAVSIFRAMRYLNTKPLHKLPGTQRYMILRQVLSVMNTRPLGSWVDTSGAGIQILTPDLLCKGYTRPNVFEVPGLTTLSDLTSLTDTLHKVRQVCREELFPDLKARVMSELERDRPDGSAPVFLAGSPVLVKTGRTAGKEDTEWKMGWILQPLEGGCCLVGEARRVVVEHHYNLCPLLGPAYGSASLLPNRNGARIWIKRFPSDTKEGQRGRPTLARQAERLDEYRWFSALILWQNRHGKLFVRWDREVSNLTADEIARWRDTEWISLPPADQWWYSSNHCIWGATDVEMTARRQAIELACRENPTHQGPGLAPFVSSQQSPMIFEQLVGQEYGHKDEPLNEMPIEPVPYVPEEIASSSDSEFSG